MSIIALKKSIESNLEKNKDLLSSIPITSEGITQFLKDITADLPINSENTSISSPNDDSLKIAINFQKKWKIKGVTLGEIDNPSIALTLTENDGKNDATLEIQGTLTVNKLNQSLPISGSLSNAEGWVVELEVATGSVPNLNDLIKVMGLSGVTTNLKTLGIKLPQVDKVWFGYNISTSSFSFVGASGSMKVGNKELVATCMFSPDLLIFGGLADGSKIELSDLLGALKINVDGVPKIALTTLNLSIHPAAKSFSASGEVAAHWSLGKIGSKDFIIENVGIDFSKSPGNTSLSIQGLSKLGSTDLSISTRLENKNILMSGSATNVNLTSIVETFLGDISFPKEIPNVVLNHMDLMISPKTKEVSFSSTSSEDWEIPLGITGIRIDDLEFSFDRKVKSTNQKNTFVTTGSFSGTAIIGSVKTSLVYNFPGDFVFKTQIPEIDFSPVIQDLCGPQALMGISVPTNVTNVKLKNIDLMAAPQQKTFSISGGSPLGESELIVSKNQQGKWAFIAAFAPPKSWKFSALDQSLKPMDSLSFGNSSLILSSAADRSVPLTVIDVPSDISISKGLTFFAALDVANLGMKDLMDISTINVSTNIDRNPANIKLAASMGGTFKITDTVSMGDMNFFLKPAPSNFELGISGAVLAKIDSSDLTFVGKMGIKPIDRSAAFAATMLGFWKNPFGVKGLTVGNLAIEVGIGIVPPPAVAAPIVGLAGTIKVGTVEGSAAVKADTANPNKSMIAASFNRLYLKEVIQTFCDKKVYNGIPKEIRNTVLNAGLEDVGVYVVPQPTTIGELFYEQGFKFQGKLSIGDFDAQFLFLLSYSEGFAIKASMDPIKIGKVFELKGVGNIPGPTLDVDLRLGGKPGILIAGMVKVLGLEAKTLVTISDKGFLFFVEGKIFELFKASLTVSGGNLKNGGDFYIKAEMKNDLIAELRKKARKGIQDAAKAATKEIEKAQKDIDKAQKEVNKINGNIASMRKTIKQERERDAKKVKDAEKAVTAAQNEVKKLQRNIESTRKTIKKERERDTKKLRSAQNEVSKAQRKVNSIQGEINSSKRRIKTLNNQIKSKKRWFDKSPWYKKSYRWAEFSAYSAAKGAEITALYTKIGSLEAAKGVAWTALEAAKQIVRGIELGAKTFPIDADPRIVALFTAKGTATAALEVAKQTLKATQAVVKGFPIDADPRIVALFTALGTATAGLQSAKLVLEGAKEVVGGLASVADFVVKYGLGGLFDVKQARFEGQLNALSGGAVSMSLKLILMRKPLNMQLSFNFKNMTKTIDSLVKKLVDEIK